MPRELSGLDGVMALELMESMLSLLVSDDGGLLFIHLFLRQLPVAVRASLANSLFLAVRDYRSLLRTCRQHLHLPPPEWQIWR